MGTCATAAGADTGSAKEWQPSPCASILAMRDTVTATGRAQHLALFPERLFLKLQSHNRGVAQLGRALRSGLNHRSRRRFFEKSRNPLKTLTFSALPNSENSANSWSDHMFDHLQKIEYFYHFEV